MKTILKTIDPKRDLDYDETFNSEKNLKIRRSLVVELRKGLVPKFRPSIDQLTTWLGCLHKSRRTQRRLKNNGKIGEDRRRIHANSRLQDVRNCNLIILFPIYILNLVDWFDNLEKNTTNKGR